MSSDVINLQSPLSFWLCRCVCRLREMNRPRQELRGNSWAQGSLFGTASFSIIFCYAERVFAGQQKVVVYIAQYYRGWCETFIAQMRKNFEFWTPTTFWSTSVKWKDAEIRFLLDIVFRLNSCCVRDMRLALKTELLLKTLLSFING